MTATPSFAWRPSAVWPIACASLISVHARAAGTNALTPAEELASFHLADSRLIAELIAAEPDVVSPVAMAFDADGRLFVAEMIDYPNARSGGRIKLLEDRDGDGRYETASVFATELPFPNGVLPWNGGLLVTAAPDIWFLADTNADGRADTRRVLFSGFGTGNQQLRVNGLTWGLDNWVYGANGRSEGEIRGGSLSAPISIRGHDFRFRPTTGEFEAIAGRSQFGLARDDWGNRFLSWNTIPIRHEVLPERYLNRNPNLASTESVLDIIAPGDNGRVFPLTPPPLTFNNESVKHFNALAGLTIFRGDAIGDMYRGNAFMGESLLNLVHRRILEPDGVTFVARRGETEREFLASTDPWFHAVNFATGPDGALYVADFYRRFVEHPDFVHTKNRDEIPWRAGAEHGRIWRIRNPQIQTRHAKPALTQASSVELVKRLADENGWWRDTAQRLLIERQDRAVIGALIQLARNAASPLARLHALYTLDGLNALTGPILISACEDSVPRIREHAIRLSEHAVSGKRSSPSPAETESVSAAILKLADDADPRVRLQLALTVGQFEGAARFNTLTQLARHDYANRWHTLAILSSLSSAPWPFLKELVEHEPQWLESPADAKAAFLNQVAKLVGASHTDADLAECLALITRRDPTSSNGRLTLLAGLGDGMARSPQSLRRLIEQPSATLRSQIEALIPLISLAAKEASSPKQTRFTAIRVLARATPDLSAPTLLELLRTEEPPAIQRAAVTALVDLDDPASVKSIFARWSKLSGSTRRSVLAALSQSTTGTRAIADALDQRTLAPVELDPASRQSLLKRSDSQLKERFNRHFQNASDRDEVARRFEPALKLSGNRQQGATIFGRVCLQCHTVEGQGRQVGPDLSAIASRPREALLVDILDPSRQVSPDFINYTLTTTEGKIVTGIITSETAAGVTLRHAGEADETVLRRDIKELRAEGKSLMPDGLEQGLTAQDLADLLSFLQKPEASLLPDIK